MSIRFLLKIFLNNNEFNGASLSSQKLECLQILKGYDGIRLKKSHCVKKF